jgi:ABC-type branched-subunit amino acid transport system ATPase component
MQGGKTFPSLSVAENLALGVLPLPRRKRKQAINETAELFQLTGDLRKPAGILSGGQRQRLAIAIVMAGRPTTLLLDEPSAGLTPLLVQGIFRILRRYQQEHGVSILLVEQHLSAAIDFADRVVVLVDGRVVRETKDPQQVLSKKVLDSLFRADGEKLALS